MGMKTKKMKSIDIMCSSPSSTAICKATVTKLNSYLGDHCKASDLNYQCLTPRRKSSADVSHSHLHKHTNSSSRYLLGDSPFSQYSTVLHSKERELRKSRRDKEGNHNSLALLNPSDQPLIKSKLLNINDSSSSSSSSSSSCAPPPEQVVTLRVSLHCKACEAKLRKYLSKMEGVTSFNIDMETKRVTVMGKVSPLEVLTRISKVKNAQLWPSSSTSSSSSSSSSTSTSSKTQLSYCV